MHTRAGTCRQESHLRSGPTVPERERLYLSATHSSVITLQQNTLRMSNAHIENGDNRQAECSVSASCGEELPEIELKR